MDYNLPGSSFHGIFLARILEWVAISFCRGSSQPRDQTQVSHISCIAGKLFIAEPHGKLYLRPYNWHKVACRMSAAVKHISIFFFPLQCSEEIKHIPVSDRNPPGHRQPEGRIKGTPLGEAGGDWGSGVNRLSQVLCLVLIPSLNTFSPTKWKSLSCVRFFETPWTIQSMEFSRPEYWSG